MHIDDFFSKWPPKASLPKIVSWVEAARGPEDYLVPETPADVITRRTAFTAGTAWFPDDRTCPALIRLHEDRIIGVTVYDGDDLWVLQPRLDSVLWHQDDRNTMFSSVRIDLHDEKRFPLRIATDLVNPVLKQPMRILIKPGGMPSRW